MVLIGELVAKIYTSTQAKNLTPVVGSDSNKAVKNLDVGSIRKHGVSIARHSTEIG